MQKFNAGISKESGGTILGFIVGLIIGLGIAVVVAMVVTKSSIPFSSKQGNQGKISEPTASQITDPNKPLYGNSAAAKEAAKSFTKEEESSEKSANAKGDVKKDAKADVKKDAKDDAKKDAKAEAKKEAKSNAKDDAKKDAKAEAKKDDKSDDKWTYYLQTNAYRDGSEAESERAKLALTGFEARISETTSQGAPLYRVRMGPFSNIEIMNRVRGKLTDSGINAAVVRIPK